MRKLEKAFVDAGLAVLKTRDAMQSLMADAAGRSFLPLIADIERTTQALNTLIDVRLKSGGEVTGSEKVGNVRLVQLEQEKEATVRVAEATAQIALMYPAMTMEGAKQLYTMQQQLTVAQSKVGADQLAAQQQATINTLVLQGVPAHEAIARAAAQRAITEATVAQQATAQINVLNGQLAIAQARTKAEELVAQEIAKQAQLMAQNVPLALAAKQAAIEREIAEANVGKSIRDQIKSLEDQLELTKARQEGNEASVKAAQAYTKALKEGASVGQAGQIASLVQENAEASAEASVEMANNSKQIGDVFAIGVDNWHSMEQRVQQDAG